MTALPNAPSGAWPRTSSTKWPAKCASLLSGAVPTSGPLQIRHLRSAKCKKWCRNGSLICGRSSGRHNRLGVLAGDGSSRRKGEPRKTRTTRNRGSKPQLLATKGHKEHKNSNHGTLGKHGIPKSETQPQRTDYTDEDLTGGCRANGDPPSINFGRGN